ncbi:MAG: hypothetical protein A4E71_02581 [Smithella sp. PtaU1.Bin162]|nr:MAG: hypothetical protein A4E71_02581 [Smithella sp. PtaU1.Bin162]
MTKEEQMPQWSKLYGRQITEMECDEILTSDQKGEISKGKRPFAPWVS